MPAGEYALFPKSESAFIRCTSPCIPGFVEDTPSSMQVRSVTCKVKTIKRKKPIILPIRVICKSVISLIYPFFRQSQWNSLMTRLLLRKAIQSAMRLEWLIRASSKVKRDIFDFFAFAHKMQSTISRDDLSVKVVNASISSFLSSFITPL